MTRYLLALSLICILIAGLAPSAVATFATATATRVATTLSIPPIADAWINEEQRVRDN